MPPYVPQDDRRQLYAPPARPARTPGELNFQLTQACLQYLGDRRRYADFNDAIGALECAKLELYRRMAAPYEDQKIEEQGDVYP